MSNYDYIPIQRFYLKWVYENYINSVKIIQMMSWLVNSSISMIKTLIFIE